jgi:lipopolysaccharide biosynthesis glycosyltransferase
MNRIWIGYDPREHKAFVVAKASIKRRASTPFSIKPLKLQRLIDSGVITRPIEHKDGRMWCPISQAPMATEFAISRFAVPLLQKDDWALFMDCDVVCLADIAELFALADPKYAVMVVKHQQPVKEGEIKMDNQVQTFYERKNWSSVMLFNCSHPSNQKLTLKVLNTWPGRDLHAFKWLADEEIGELPQEWNHLVGVTQADPATAKILHYTLGGPWFKNWTLRPSDEIWLAEAKL